METHKERNIRTRKQKSKRRMAHLRRLQKAYDRLWFDYGNLYEILKREQNKDVKKIKS